MQKGVKGIVNKIKNNKFKECNSNYQIVVGCDSNFEILRKKLNFGLTLETKLLNIDLLGNNCIINVIGVIKNFEPIKEWHSKTEKYYEQQVFTLVDASGMVECTLWYDQIIRNTAAFVNKVVIITNAKVNIWRETKGLQLTKLGKVNLKIDSAFGM